jgi:6-methylsalicylate decarboxylase
MPTDLHQHLLPEALIHALLRRSAPPRLVPDGRGLRLELAGEPPSVLQAADHDPEARADEAAREGIDRIVISLSTALGIEALPTTEAAPLLDAFNHGILDLGGPFELWATAQTPADVDALLDAGARGLTLPAAALIDGRADGLLDRLEARDAPLFVHPGPVPAGSAEAPAWWPAMTDYVAQMSAAWHAFAAWGRPRHPRLRVVFAMLAGLGPLHAERLAARGGPTEAIHDPNVWFDSSSYGERTLDSMLRLVGVDRLVHGSDRPIIAASDPRVLGDAVEHALTIGNPERVLGATPVLA